MAQLAFHMSAHHRECDELFSCLDVLTEADDWAAAVELLQCVRDELYTHFRVEEELVFPRFECVTGMVDGSTQVMRQEHARMRILLEQLEASVADRNLDQFLGESDTLSC